MFSTTVTLFTNLPIGCRFRRAGFLSIYTKVDGWKAARAGKSPVRIPAGCPCYIEVQP